MKDFYLHYDTKIKLNDVGIEIIKQKAEESRALMSRVIPKLRDFSYNNTLSLIDNEGYVTAPMWELIQLFGPHMANNKQPFETTNVIIFNPDDLKSSENFNLNDNVKVQLNNTGINIVKNLENIREILTSLNSQKKQKETIPQLDNDNHITMPMWELIKTFALYNNFWPNNYPFTTEYVSIT